MRTALGLLILFIVACAPGEEEVHRVTANMDLDNVPRFLAAIDRQTDSDLGVSDLLALTNSVPMDEEKQQEFSIVYQGAGTTLIYHVWREQADWVHLYLSTPSEALFGLIDSEAAKLARPPEP